jgi:hypothetical protein
MRVTWRIRLDHTILTVACSWSLKPPAAAPPKGGMPGKFILLGVICDLRDEKVWNRTNNFMVGWSVGAKSASYGEARRADELPNLISFRSQGSWHEATEEPA